MKFISSISLGSSLLLLASCTPSIVLEHRADELLYSKQVTLDFQEGCMSYRLRDDESSSWREGRWVKHHLLFPRELRDDNSQPVKWSYSLISESRGLLRYQTEVCDGGCPMKYEIVLDFKAANRGVAHGTGSDFEWEMRYKKVPFEIRPY